MKRKLIVSIDVERDIVRYLSDSWTGVDLGMPVLLELTESLGVVPDLFIESLVAGRNPGLIHRALRQGCLIGAHGRHIDPLVATQLKDESLRARVHEGIEAIRTATGKRPTVYREANFAVDARVLRILIESGFKVDSSVLPNRRVRKKRIIPLVDHRGAPEVPYWPGSRNHRMAGTRGILEIPISNNPENPGGPIGSGFLNWRGVDATLRALRTCSGDPVTFLIHPWECVDLANASPDLPSWVIDISKENSHQMTDLLNRSREWFELTSIRGVAEDLGVSVE